jgi:hypothetical protein
MHGDAIADFWQREAQQPVELPWLGDSPNQTQLNKMAKEKPELHRMVTESLDVARHWAKGIIAEARAQQVSAETILTHGI